jgi:hypothetical protein
MEQDIQNHSVSEQSPGPVDQTQSSVSNEEKPTQNSVAYDTHRRILREKKEAVEKLAEYERREREAEEAKAAEKGDFHKVVGTYKERTAQLERENEELRQANIVRAKLNAFMKKVPGQIVNDEYLSFVKIDNIAIDPDTGEVDQLSLDSEVNSYVKDHGHLIRPHNGARLPAHQKVGEFGKPSVKSVKEMSDKELKDLFISGKFKS